MKYKYIGDHEKITQHEVTFYRNEPVDVTGKFLERKKKVFDARGNSTTKITKISVEEKLRGNPDFEEVFEYEGNEIIPKQRKKPGPKPKHGNQADDQKQGFAPA